MIVHVSSGQCWMRLAAIINSKQNELYFCANNLTLSYTIQNSIANTKSLIILGIASVG